MRLSKDQIQIVLDLSDGPRSYVPAMQDELEGLEKEGLIHVIFRPSPLVQPIWGLTKKGRLAVTVARVLISAAPMSRPKEKPPAPGSMDEVEQRAIQREAQLPEKPVLACPKKWAACPAAGHCLARKPCR